MSVSHRYNTRSKKNYTPIAASYNPYNTRSTDRSNASIIGIKLCKEALAVDAIERPNERVEKMIKFMRWIRTHKILLVRHCFKKTSYRKCHEYLNKIESPSYLSGKHANSRLLRSLSYESSLIIDIIENEFGRP